MFKSAKLKIKRADQHITDLEGHLWAFTRDNFNTSVTYHDPNAIDITFTAATVPDIVTLTIGDAVHNLWSSMDHLLWELVGQDHQHKDLYFPKGRDRQS